MRIEHKDKQQVQIAVHPEEASLLVSELKSHTSLLEGETDDLIEALEDAGVEPFEFPANYRMEYTQGLQRIRRARPEDVTLARQEVVGM